MNPVKDLKMLDVDFSLKYKKYQSMVSSLENSKCHLCPKLSETFTLVQQRMMLTKKLRNLKHLVSNESLALFPEFNQRLEVLEQLHYIDVNHNVQLKGRVACEINTADELILTELIFENVLTSLEPEEICALLSSLVFQGKSSVEPSLPDRLEAAKLTLIRIAENLGKLQAEAAMNVIGSEFAREKCSFAIMEVVYEWSRGVPFKYICEITDIEEGTIVRTITRLDETCREVRNAARIIGDPVLYRKSKFLPPFVVLI